MKSLFVVCLMMLPTVSMGQLWQPNTQFPQPQTVVVNENVNQNLVPVHPVESQTPSEWMRNGYREQFTRTETHDVYPFRDYNYPGNTTGTGTTVGPVYDYRYPGGVYYPGVQYNNFQPGYACDRWYRPTTTYCQPTTTTYCRPTTTYCQPTYYYPTNSGCYQQPRWGGLFNNWSF